MPHHCHSLVSFEDILVSFSLQSLNFLFWPLYTRAWIGKFVGFLSALTKCIDVYKDYTFHTAFSFSIYFVICVYNACLFNGLYVMIFVYAIIYFLHFMLRLFLFTKRPCGLC